MECRYFDLDVKKTIERWPTSYYQIYQHKEVVGRHVWPRLTIHADGFNARIEAMYGFCCGVREIGDIYLHSGVDVKKIRAEFITKLQTSFPFETIGALSYTLVKWKDGVSYHSEKVQEFIKKWPGASHGDWFYNPNSRRYVQQWTLPINQHLDGIEEQEIEDED